MGSPFGNEKLDITYPSPWPYTVIGEDEFKMRVAIGEICDELEHFVEVSNRSRTGRYCSLKIEAIVNSDEERHAIYHKLLQSDEIRYVV